MADLVERLLSMRASAEETDDAEITDGDPRCVFVPMLPEDFDALLVESATELEALRKRCEAVEADAGKWRRCNAIYDLGDGERIECHVIVGVNSWKGKRWNGFHQPSADEFFETLASIDPAIAAAQEPSHG